MKKKVLIISTSLRGEVIQKFLQRNVKKERKRQDMMFNSFP